MIEHCVMLSDRQTAKATAGGRPIQSCCRPLSLIRLWRDLGSAWGSVSSCLIEKGLWLLLKAGLNWA